MSKSKSSGGSVFRHDLFTVDFSKVDKYTGVRAATILVPIIVLGFITRHDTALAIMAAGFVLAIDEMRPPGPRTLLLLLVSVIYTAFFALGMIISMVDYLVVPLLALGVFFIVYLRVFPKAFSVLFFAGIFFILELTTHNATLTRTGVESLQILIGGLWVIPAGAIFPSHKYLKRQTADQSVHERQQQSRAKLTRQDSFKLFTSNLSIHSQYFQNALALAITIVIGLLIAQWLKLKEPAWLLITIWAVLVPAFPDISLAFRVGRRIIGTFIGAIIAIVIIHYIDNQVLLAVLLVVAIGIYVSVINTRNYAFTLIFMTVVILLLRDIPDPSRNLILPITRFENIVIGSLLSLLTAFIIWIVPKIGKGAKLEKSKQ